MARGTQAPDYGEKGRRALQEADAPGLSDAERTERLTRAQAYLLAHIADSLDELTGPFGSLRSVASTMDQLSGSLTAAARRFGDQ